MNTIFCYWSELKSIMSLHIGAFENDLDIYGERRVKTDISKISDNLSHFLN